MSAWFLPSIIAMYPGCAAVPSNPLYSSSHSLTNDIPVARGRSFVPSLVALSSKHESGQVRVLGIDAVINKICHSALLIVAFA